MEDKGLQRKVAPAIETNKVSQASAPSSLSAREKKQKARKASALERDVVESTQEVLKKTKRRGGWRPHSGRRPNYLKKSGLPPIAAHVILAHYDVVKLWGDLLNSKDEDVRLRTLMYLTNREQGCPKEVGEFRSEARTNASMSMTVRFVSADANRTELPAQNADETTEHAVPALGRTGPRYVRFIPAGAENSTAAPPDAEPAKPQPAANCRIHGPYAISNWQSSEPCPRCVEEAAEVERKLRNMMPGGGWA